MKGAIENVANYSCSECHEDKAAIEWVQLGATCVLG